LTSTQRLNDRLLAHILMDSADAIIFLDPLRRIRTWNRGAQLIYGYAASEIVGESFERLVPGDLLASGELQRIDELLDKTGVISHYETERLAKDGRRIRVELSCANVLDETGTLMGRSVIHRDVTEQRRMERELIQSEKLSVIGKLSAHVAHEIRNPLSSIRLNLELLRDELDSGASANLVESRTLLEAIQTEVDVLTRFTDEYLQLTRPPRFQKCEVDLVAFIDEVVASLREKAAHDQLTFQILTEPGIPSIEADPVRLQQALSSITQNAIEAMPGGGTLRFQIATRADFVQISVQDTGPGIAPSILPKIFEPFFTTKDGGTGLGLPLSRQILREHGGDLEVSSVQGNGATFILKLPRGAAAAEGAELPTNVQPS
jgi:PAS domain S-box-containing protein